MKLTPRLFSGIWFCIGTIIVMVIVFFNGIYNQDPFDTFRIILTFLFATASSFYWGTSYSNVILTNDAFSIKKIMHVIIYGLQIAVVTLYTTFFSLFFVLFFIDRFLMHIYEKDYFSIISELLFIPLLALVPTFMGCIFFPVILIASTLGAIGLFLIRNWVFKRTN